MKTKLFITTLAFFAILSVKATDLIVEEFGISPSYSSIGAAVSAANDGDRIFIMNRTGNIPWIENITITKSIELLSFAVDTFFVVQGNYTISPAAAGKTISIIGMRNTSGYISSGGNAPAGIRTKVNILNCYLEAGYVNVNGNNFNLNFSSSKINNGTVYFKYGRILGNQITSSVASAVILNSEPSFTSDTTLIFGNKIICTSVSDPSINIDARYNLFRIYNNYIEHSQYGINIANTVLNSNGNGFVNQIYNNTILAKNTSNTHFGMSLAVSSGSVLEVMNNVIKSIAVGTKYGITGTNSGQANLYYNHIDASINLPIVFTPTSSVNNTTNVGFSLTSDGHLAAGAPGIDGANPSPVFYDLNLTVGDAGAYGGSYTLDNYFPQFFGGARVYHVAFPRNVRQGSSISVKADGFDR